MSPDRWCPSNTRDFYDQIDAEIEEIKVGNRQIKEKTTLEGIEKQVDLLPNERLKHVLP